MRFSLSNNPGRNFLHHQSSFSALDWAGHPWTRRESRASQASLPNNDSWRMIHMDIFVRLVPEDPIPWTPDLQPRQNAVLPSQKNWFPIQFHDIHIRIPGFPRWNPILDPKTMGITWSWLSITPCPDVNWIRRRIRRVHCCIESETWVTSEEIPRNWWIKTQL